MKLDDVTKGQNRELNKIATIFSNEKSKRKGYFPDGKEFTRPDKLKLARNIKIIFPTITSLFQAPHVIRTHNPNKVKTNLISDKDFKLLNDFILNELKMSVWGVTKLEEKDVFIGEGIPFGYAIVLSHNMDNEKFLPNTLPSMDCQLEVMRVYGTSGSAALKVTKFLRKLGYAAAPNHGLGGNIDYVKTGMQANIGYIGKHGMLITKENGPCNRLSIVYVDITNLDTHLQNDHDFSWGYDFCSKCKKCVRSCPYQAIYDVNKMDEHGNIQSISNDKCNSGFNKYGCGICVGVCPFTSIGYDKLHHAFHNKKRSS